MSMSVEAVVLTGGASRRMGRDKASLVIEGTPLAHRVISEIEPVVSLVTVLGQEEIAGHAFLKDAEEYSGPLSALKRFSPSADFVFVCSCDLPLFDSAIVKACMIKIGEADVCVPVVDGSRQPLCALYRSSCFAAMQDCSSRSMMGFLDTVNVVEIGEDEIGVLPASVRSANTPEELDKLMEQR